MGIREVVNRSPRAATAAAAVVVLAGAVLIARQVGPRGAGVDVAGQQVFLSRDDGKTYAPGPVTETFAEGAGPLPAQAVVFRCGSRPPFVGYLLRFNDETRVLLRTAHAKGAAALESAMTHAGPAGAQVKRPGDKAWADPGTAAALAIVDVTCPGGTAAERPTPVVAE